MKNLKTSPTYTLGDNAIVVVVIVVHSCSSQGYKTIEKNENNPNKFLLMCMVLMDIDVTSFRIDGICDPTETHS